jgi:hypothetical protein
LDDDDEDSTNIKTKAAWSPIIYIMLINTRK